jgi:hypothetical protein
MDTSPRENTPEFIDALTRSVLRRVVGSAIVARVRSTPAIRHVLLEAFAVALLFGILGHKLVGIPIFVCFFATMVLFAEAVLQVHFAAIHALYKEWTTFRRKAYLTVGIVGLGHVLVAKALQIATPAEIYAEVVRLGGFGEMLLHNTATNEILLAMCLDVLLLMVSVRAVFENHRKAWRQLLIVAGVSLLLIINPVNWRAVDECLASRGLIPCAFGYIRSLLFG